MSFIDGVRLSEQERQAEQDRALRAQQIAQQNQISQQNYLMAQERARRDQADWDQKQADRNFLMGGNVTPDALRQRGMFQEANYMESVSQKKAEEAEKRRQEMMGTASTMVTNLSRMKPEEASALYPKLREQFVSMYGEDPKYQIPAQYDPAWVQGTMTMFSKPKDDKGIKLVDYLDAKGNKVTVNANTGNVVSTTPREMLYAPQRESAADKAAIRQDKREQDKIAANDKAIEESRRYMAQYKDSQPLDNNDPVYKANYLKANETKSTGDWEKTRYMEARPYVNKLVSDKDVVAAAKSLAGRGYSKQQIKEILKAAGAQD